MVRARHTVSPALATLNPRLMYSMRHCHSCLQAAREALAPGGYMSYVALTSSSAHQLTHSRL